MDEPNSQRRFQSNAAALPMIGESEPIHEEREDEGRNREEKEERLDYSTRSKTGPIIPSRSPARAAATLPQSEYFDATRKNTVDTTGAPPSNQSFRTSSMSTNNYSRPGQTTLSIPDSQSQYSPSDAPRSATYGAGPTVTSPLENTAISFPPPLSSPGTPYNDPEMETNGFREQQQQQNGRAPIRLDTDSVPRRTDSMNHSGSLHPASSIGSRERRIAEEGVESPIPTRQVPSPVEMISSRLPEPATTPRQAARAVPGQPMLGSPVDQEYLDEQNRLQQSLSSSRGTESDYSQTDARPNFQSAVMPIPSTSSNAPVTLRRSYDMAEDHGIHSDVRFSPLLYVL